eukprot:GHVS01084858.1.p1 GENE.GHVS01084858.1~~GHVS01084858.1.p1  ORF type:complete len:101 (-),score=15.41 GHVS01084858.1:44-346(-)
MHNYMKHTLYIQLLSVQTTKTHHLYTTAYTTTTASRWGDYQAHKTHPLYVSTKDGFCAVLFVASLQLLLQLLLKLLLSFYYHHNETLHTTTTAYLFLSPP